jgi:carboxymethylenebutenolidase
MPRTLLSFAAGLACAALGAAAFFGRPDSSVAAPTDEHAEHGAHTDAAATPALQDTTIPAGAGTAAARIAASPRHAEWVKVAVPGMDSIMAWVVYPERRDNAPVLVVIHEIFGLSTWVRGVADQAAADGFIAIAPDLISIERGGATSVELAADSARGLIQRVTPDKMNAMVAAVGQYGMSLPAAKKVYGVVGYCWGGTASWNHAIAAAPGLGAAVVYYGGLQPAQLPTLAKVKVPVLGLYGQNDQRVNATIPAIDSTMKALGKPYRYEIYDGAGHGFLRAQDGNVPNAAAAAKAWPATVAFFKQHLNR